MTGDRVLGAVLAGGESRRFGSDKWAATLGGERLLDRAVSTLAAVVAEVVVVSGRATHPTAPTVPDLRPGVGPLAGVETALAEAERRGCRGVVVLAADLPLVTPETIRALLSVTTEVAAVAAARDGSPPFEPLCAFYDVRCLPVVRAALDGGMRPAATLFERVDGSTVEVREAELVNVNTVEELERARAGLPVAGPRGSFDG